MLRPLSVVVIALLALPGCGGESAPDGEQAVISRATAGPETGDLLLHGELTRDGKPVTNGKVWVTLLPEDDNLPEGEAVPTWESAVATSDDDGTFAVSVDPEKLTSRFYNGEYLNYEINVLQDDSLASWNTTAWLVAEGVWRSDPDALVGDPILHVAVDVGAPTITLTDSVTGSETSKLLVAHGIPADRVLP